MSKLFIARVRGASGERSLVTVRAAAEGEAKLFVEAASTSAESAPTD